MPISKTGAFPLGYTPKTSVQANHKEQNPRFVKRKQLPKFNFFHETIKIIMEKMRFYQTSKIAVIHRIAKITVDFGRNYLTRNFIQFGLSAP